MTQKALALRSLRPGQRIRGLVPGKLVTFTSFAPMDDSLVEIYCRDDDGNLRARAITTADTERLDTVADLDSAGAFDADPHEFRLAAESLRIKYGLASPNRGLPSLRSTSTRAELQ